MNCMILFDVMFFVMCVLIVFGIVICVFSCFRFRAFFVFMRVLNMCFFIMSVIFVFFKVFCYLFMRMFIFIVCNFMLRK